MVILVTGGAGYIGSHTCLELLRAGHQVIVVDNLCNSSREAVNRVEKLAGKSIIFYQADVTDEAALAAIFAQHTNIDGIIHFAGLKAVGESVVKPQQYYYNNIVGTLVLSKMMAQFGIKNIVFSSSATVYGENEIPFVETMSLGVPTNPYGQTKLMSEQILKDMAVAHQEWSVVLLRYFNPVGAHESGQIGEAPQGIPNNLMPFISQVAAGRLEKLNIFGNDYPTPDGTCIRDYIHVCDLAEGHVRALEKLADKSGVHVYNLGTGQGTSVMQLLTVFERVNQLHVPYTIAPRRAGDIAAFYADASKAERELGWRAVRDIEAMCRDTWLWQTMNPHGYDQ